MKTTCKLISLITALVMLLTATAIPEAGPASPCRATPSSSAASAISSRSFSPVPAAGTAAGADFRRFTPKTPNLWGFFDGIKESFL